MMPMRALTLPRAPGCGTATPQERPAGSAGDGASFALELALAADTGEALHGLPERAGADNAEALRPELAPAPLLPPAIAPWQLAAGDSAAAGAVVADDTAREPAAAVEPGVPTEAAAGVGAAVGQPAARAVEGVPDSAAVALPGRVAPALAPALIAPPSRFAGQPAETAAAAAAVATLDLRRVETHAAPALTRGPAHAAEPAALAPATPMPAEPTPEPPRPASRGAQHAVPETPAATQPAAADTQPSAAGPPDAGAKAAPVPPAPLAIFAVGAPAQPVIQQIAGGLREVLGPPVAPGMTMAAPAGERMIEIALDPADLGSVVVRLTLGAGGVTVRIEAEGASAHRRLTEGGGELAAMLAGAGYAVEALSVVRAVEQGVPGQPATGAGAGGSHDEARHGTGRPPRDERDRHADMPRQDGRAPAPPVRPAADRAGYV